MKVAIDVRRGVLKFTSVVDNDTTVHDVLQSLSPDQVWYLSFS